MDETEPLPSRACSSEQRSGNLFRKEPNQKYHGFADRLQPLLQLPALPSTKPRSRSMSLSPGRSVVSLTVDWAALQGS